jgi:hypothetical protein
MTHRVQFFFCCVYLIAFYRICETSFFAVTILLCLISFDQFIQPHRQETCSVSLLSVPFAHSDLLLLSAVASLLPRDRRRLLALVYVTNSSSLSLENDV